MTNATANQRSSEGPMPDGAREENKEQHNDQTKRPGKDHTECPADCTTPSKEWFLDDVLEDSSSRWEDLSRSSHHDDDAVAVAGDVHDVVDINVEEKGKWSSEQNNNIFHLRSDDDNNNNKDDRMTVTDEVAVAVAVADTGDDVSPASTKVDDEIVEPTGTTLEASNVDNDIQPRPDDEFTSISREEGAGGIFKGNAASADVDSVVVSAILEEDIATTTSRTKELLPLPQPAVSGAFTDKIENTTAVKVGILKTATPSTIKRPSEKNEKTTSRRRNICILIMEAVLACLVAVTLVVSIQRGFGDAVENVFSIVSSWTGQDSLTDETATGIATTVSRNVSADEMVPVESTALVPNNDDSEDVETMEPATTSGLNSSRATGGDDRSTSVGMTTCSVFGSDYVELKCIATSAEDGPDGIANLTKTGTTTGSKGDGKHRVVGHHGIRVLPDKPVTHHAADVDASFEDTMSPGSFQGICKTQALSIGNGDDEYLGHSTSEGTVSGNDNNNETSESGDDSHAASEGNIDYPESDPRSMGGSDTLAGKDVSDAKNAVLWQEEQDDSRRNNDNLDKDPKTESKPRQFHRWGRTFQRHPLHQLPPREKEERQ